LADKRAVRDEQETQNKGGQHAKIHVGHPCFLIAAGENSQFDKIETLQNRFKGRFKLTCRTVRPGYLHLSHHKNFAICSLG
jgi:hypothetical protein